MPMTVTGVTELVATLGEIPAELKVALKPAVLEAAGLIAAQAKENASFSSYIPSAISTAASFSGSGGGAIVRVAERGYPHAGEVRVMEGEGYGAAPFRHPVYGNTNKWVSQMSHPFLHPALEETRDEAAEVIAAAVAAVIAANGLGG